jgi:hypothetical protein
VMTHINIQLIGKTSSDTFAEGVIL